ncbi:MAG: 2-oxo acid dehydrogenase subunit E2 [Chloroflexota bacterium]
MTDFGTPAHSYTEKSWPPMRDLVGDFLAQTKRTDVMYGMSEADIGPALDRIQHYKAQLNGNVSFTAFLVYCLARAVDQHKIMHAYRRGRKLVMFDDVDVNTLLEKKKPDGSLVPVAYTVRAANQKSLAQINHEMHKASSTSLRDDAGVQRRAQLLQLPKPVRRLLGWWVRREPTRLKQHWGTVGLSNVGMFLPQRPMWGIAPPFHTTAVIVGGMYERVCWGADGPEPRTKLCMTLTNNHAIVDGAPAARFAVTLGDYIESASGLDDAFAAESAQLMGITFEPENADHLPVSEAI